VTHDHEFEVPFSDRVAAGDALAAVLGDHPELTAGAPVVVALPRGGVPVAAPVAAELGAPLDVLVVRKLGQPGRPELGLGALAEDGAPIWNDALLRDLGLTPDDLADVVPREAAELARRVARYRGDRPAEPVEGRSVVVVDDGLATGATMRAAVAAVRRSAPARVLVAVPVGSPNTCAALASAVDDVVCLWAPASFSAVGQGYDDFGATSDDEVREALATGASRGN